MNEERIRRSLKAIFSADVKGYSRLMGADDEATVRTLTARRAFMTTLIQQHRGRVVDSPGDNLLAEFASVVDAVRCAVEIQKELHRQNAELPPDRQMAFRMGINLGDVLTEGGRLYGDGVNIAARLEGLAEAGGICLSSIAYCLAGHPEEAIAPLKQYLARYPNILGAHLTLAAVYSELGKEAEARAEAVEVLRLNPNFSLEVYKERVPIKDPALLERHIEALRKAGFK